MRTPNATSRDQKKKTIFVGLFFQDKDFVAIKSVSTKILLLIHHAEINKQLCDEGQPFGSFPRWHEFCPSQLLGKSDFKIWEVIKILDQR